MGPIAYRVERTVPGGTSPAVNQRFFTVRAKVTLIPRHQSGYPCSP